jgi:hypothetical protein
MNSQSFKRPTRFLRAHWFTSLFVILGVGFLIWRWADWAYGQTPCPPGVTRHAPHEVSHETCPSLGRMNGVKLAIPQHYLLGPKGYKGIDIWNAESYKKRPKTNSFDNELDNFAIRIRLTNFKPIETLKDKDDYGELGSLLGVPPLENRWIHVGITAVDRRYTFEGTVGLWLKDEAHWGPYSSQPDVWGLKRYLSQQVPAPHKHQWEFMHDAKFEVFATCEHIFPLYPPHDLREACKLEFFVPELKAFIDVAGLRARTDLARWPEIEREVRKVIQSFIVP